MRNFSLRSALPLFSRNTMCQLARRLVLAPWVLVAVFSTDLGAQTVGSCVDTEPFGDDWGWNYALQQSCRLSAHEGTDTTAGEVNGNCVDTPPYDDNWGWNPVRLESCRLSEISSPDNTGSPETFVDSCVDTEPFDDNWGWNFVLLQSCQLTDTGSIGEGAGTSTEQENNDASAASSSENCIDTPPFSDDWGWDPVLGESCRLSASASSDTAEGAGSGLCVDTPPLDDDWGWDFMREESCRLSAGQNTDSESETSAPSEPQIDAGADAGDGTAGSSDGMCISEFMADNDLTLIDSDGDYSDWIELHNAGSDDVDLTGWCLTDDAADPDQWCFAGGVLQAQQYLVVFASDKDRQDGAEPHTNFKLGKGGEYLALFNPQGQPVCEFSPEYPPQNGDISYGDDGSRFGYFELPSPGAANVSPALRAPQIEPVAAIELIAGDSLQLLLSASDADLDPLQWNGESLPAWTLLTDRGDGTATLDLAPLAAESGSIELSVSDGLLSTEIEIDFEVTSADTQPPDGMADLNIVWGTHPWIVDAANERLLMSLDSSFSNQSTATALLDYEPSAPNRVLMVDGQIVAPGEQLTLSIAHGESLPVVLTQDGIVTDEYRLVASNLPIFQIDAELIVDEPKLPGTMRWVDGTRDFDSGVRNLGIEWRGQTSLQLPKKSYGFEVREDADPEEGDNIRLLGLRNDDDWIADAAYRDQTLVRNLVSHDLWRAMWPYAYLNEDGEQKGQSTIAGDLAEIVLNGAYQGTYVVEERVDRKLLGLEKVTVPEDDGGDRWDLVDFTDPANGSVLFKAEGNQANFYHPELTAREFEQKYPDPDDEAERSEVLAELIAFVNDSPDDVFIAEIGDRVNLDSVADFWILRMVTSNADTFKKNYYMARNRAQRWFIVPWDFDATFGMWWTGAPDPDSVRFFDPDQNALVGRLSRLTATGFNEQVAQRWNAMRSDILTVDAIVQRFTDYRQSYQPAGTESPRSRNLMRWPHSGNLGEDFPELGELDFLRQWLIERLTFLDQTIAALPR